VQFLYAKNGTYTGDFKASVIEYMDKRGLSARANTIVIFIVRELIHMAEGIK